MGREMCAWAEGGDCLQGVELGGEGGGGDVGGAGAGEEPVCVCVRARARSRVCVRACV